MLIRDATEADLPRIVEIYNAAIPGRKATADTEPVSVESRREWFCSHHPQTRPLLVMQTEEGEVVAWAGVRSFYGRPAYAKTVESALYVAPEYQGRGIGAVLFKRLLERCRAAGIETVLGFVFAHNTPSIELMRRCGYEKWGHLPAVAEMDGRKYDVEIWGCRLRQKEGGGRKAEGGRGKDK